jgi:hypothetical protein
MSSPEDPMVKFVGIDASGFIADGSTIRDSSLHGRREFVSPWFPTASEHRRKAVNKKQQLLGASGATTVRDNREYRGTGYVRVVQEHHV